MHVYSRSADFFFALNRNEAIPQAIRKEDVIHRVLNGEITSEAKLAIYRKTVQSAVESIYAEKSVSNLIQRIDKSCAYISPLTEEFKSELNQQCRSILSPS